uniref:Uncharacterized protein n=1 Tax=Anguilla anguilla TaxID=7936 RepID=A0A0E9XSW9_ANGAN
MMQNKLFADRICKISFFWD